MYEGKPWLMLEADGWRNVGRWTDDAEGGVEWFFFAKDQDHSAEWKTYKVVANGRVENKANYWFTRNDKTMEVGFSRDLAAMIEGRPRLYERTMRILNQSRVECPLLVAAHGMQS